MTLFSWSQTALSNQTADTTINLREGQAPSSLNDSCRAMMAAAAKYRDDLGGTAQQGGTASAYTVTSNQGTGGTLHNGFSIAFQVNNANNNPVTLSVDGSTAKPLRYATGSELPASLLRVGMIAEATYFSGTGEWILLDIFDPTAFISSTNYVQTGFLQDYLGTSAPSGWVLGNGTTIGDGSSGASQRANADTSALYTLLWNAISTLAVSTGRGLSASADFAAHKTLALPNFCGRVTAGLDNMGGISAAGVITGGTTLGASGGEQTHILTTTEMPSHTHTANVTDPGHHHTVGSDPSSGPAAGSGGTHAGTVNTSTATTGITVTNVNAGSDGAHNNLQPYMLVNKIIKL